MWIVVEGRVAARLVDVRSVVCYLLLVSNSIRYVNGSLLLFMSKRFSCDVGRWGLYNGTRFYKSTITQSDAP